MLPIITNKNPVTITSQQIVRHILATALQLSSANIMATSKEQLTEQDAEKLVAILLKKKVEVLLLDWDQTLVKIDTHQQTMWKEMQECGHLYQGFADQFIGKEFFSHLRKCLNDAGIELNIVSRQCKIHIVNTLELIFNEDKDSIVSWANEHVFGSEALASTEHGRSPTKHNFILEQWKVKVCLLIEDSTPTRRQHTEGIMAAFFEFSKGNLYQQFEFILEKITALKLPVQRKGAAAEAVYLTLPNVKKRNV